MTINKCLRLPLCAVITACWLPLRADAQLLPTAAPHSESKWNVLGRSLEDRVIEYRQFGEGDRRVLVVGPLEGDETAALELVESLAEHLERFPRRTSGVRVTLVRDPNPDGRLRRTAANARGVWLDRNFSTRGWRKIPSGSLWLSGREPESEPETRALIDLLGDVEPERVIILSAVRRQAELTYFGPAEELAREFAKLTGLRPVAANLTAEQGSLAVYMGADRNVPTLVLHVPAGIRRDMAWTTYKRGLLAAIGGDTADLESMARGTDTDFAGNGLRGIAPVVGNEFVPPVAPPQTMLATSKRPPADAPGRTPTAKLAPVPSAEELESAGELVPVKPVRREFGPATPSADLPRTAQPTAQRPVANRRATIRSNSKGAYPPATLVRPGRLNPLPPSTAPSTGLTAPKTLNVERFPPVDHASPPPARQSMPQPIPLYPETGF
ncbi:MAG: M14 family zinc carboxypeptidase [Pirellulales bacterium]